MKTIGDFSKSQHEALLDLLVLAMYLDGNLASAEETRVEQLLTAMGYATQYDRDRAFDASVTRVRQGTLNSEAAKSCASRLAKQFTTPEQRKRVYATLGELIALDGHVSAEESKFMGLMRELFQL